ncbi:MAG TPA: DUF3761 domain-containing protein [Pseudonocardia sp.]|uniref:DUF3761 domain-containing protein n=1 Tax=Pseudonocardia sp. TaxID=60912 RepID=UPI002EDB00F0
MPAPALVQPLTLEALPAPTETQAPVRRPVQAQAPTRTHTPTPVYPTPPDTNSTCDEATHYINSSGNCVLRPTHAPTPPTGASAKCGDGSYSSSQHRQGTCSRHGGVAEWL